MSFTRQVLIRAPPKSVFQFIFDVTTLEEYTPWKVRPLDDSVGIGFQWQESRRLRKRTWTVTDFDRRGLSMTATCNDVTVTWAAKKGGTGSCNVTMWARGPDAAVARFEKSDGDRLDRFATWLGV